MNRENGKLLKLLQEVYSEVANANTQSIEESEKTKSEFTDIIKEVLSMLECADNNKESKLDNDLLGNAYERFKNANTRKALGQFYTPDFVIDYIMEKTVKEADVTKNPFVKILDPACGSGYFLSAAYDILKEKFEKELIGLREKYKNSKFEIIKDGKKIILSGEKYWQKENLHYHILRHCIYGADIDSFALKLTAINLLFKGEGNFQDILNLANCDSLIRWEDDYVETDKVENRMFFSNKFDYIVGNPPYIGHKDLTFEYKTFLKTYYKEIFKDKSDISYCFIYRFTNQNILKGKLSFITSRYFLESPTGELLRKYIKNSLHIESILDSYGVRILDKIGIDPVIVTLSRERQIGNSNSLSVDVIKINSLAKKIEGCSLFSLFKTYPSSPYYERFIVSQAELRDSGWILVPKEIMNIIHKIEDRCEYMLSEVCVSYQGIITGCDKAFIVDEECNEGIEPKLLKNWVKNSNVGRYVVARSRLKLIYSDLIYDEDAYKVTIQHIAKYKEKLENRRECKRGIRKWYQLQWGRNEKIFNETKIIFPYKADRNKFALDNDNNFFSADVYAMKIKNGKINYFTLLGILNSTLYEIYFKCFAKKLGDKLYDYYPNTVMRLRIPTEIGSLIENYVKKILDIKKSENDMEKSVDIHRKITDYEKEIDKFLYEYFKVNNEEIKIIEKLYLME